MNLFGWLKPKGHERVRIEALRLKKDIELKIAALDTIKIHRKNVLKALNGQPDTLGVIANCDRMIVNHERAIAAAIQQADSILNEYEQFLAKR